MADRPTIDSLLTAFTDPETGVLTDEGRQELQKFIESVYTELDRLGAEVERLNSLLTSRE